MPAGFSGISVLLCGENWCYITVGRIGFFLSYLLDGLGEGKVEEKGFFLFVFSAGVVFVLPPRGCGLLPL